MKTNIADVAERLDRPEILVVTVPIQAHASIRLWTETGWADMDMEAARYSPETLLREVNRHFGPDDGFDTIIRIFEDGSYTETTYDV